MSFALIFGTVMALFAAAQIYWFFRACAAVRRRVAGKARQRAVICAGAAGYAALMAWNFGWLGRNSVPTHLTAAEAILAAPFLWWFAGSTVAFLVAVLLWPLRRVPVPVSRSRRQFLRRTGQTAMAAPFVAGAYGLLYGRLNLETTSTRVPLARLPKVFEGFRIAQLSDIHVGPFMTEEEIRKYVGIANSLKPDLIALTGDFVTWDPDTQEAVVRALSGLRAPFGVFGCLGNHDAWSGVEDSITFLFQQAGIRILRQARAAIAHAGETWNLIGVDYSTRRMRPNANGHVVREYLTGVERLVAPEAANVLLSHNPDTFDRAAEMGIGLSLAGHTHGGQVRLEFISPELAPSRLVTPYVSGRFVKQGGELYVNRGIGTIGVPIRLGSRPEISVFELVRRA